MRMSLRLGGEGWRLELGAPGLLNEQKFAAYLGAADGPEMSVRLEDSLTGESNRPPVLCEQSGGWQFRAHEARWTSDLDFERLDACVGRSTLALERAITAWVCSRSTRAGGLLLHAAAIRSAKGAILLLGPSGAGKSTAASLAGDRRLCTNAVVLKREATVWQVYTTPFTGARDPYPTEAGPFPLAGALVLEKAAVSMGPQPLQGLPLIAFARAVVAQFPSTAQFASSVLESIAGLAATCPVSRLPFCVDSIVFPN
jgi:hypothetical protein